MTTSIRPLLTGDKVELREFVKDDLDSVLSLVGDERVTRSLSFNSRSREQASDMLDGIITRSVVTPRTEWYLAVEVKRQVVGFARIALNGVQAAKLGYAIGADFWGNGYATDAARTLIRYGFSALHLHRISAAIGPDNSASIAVVQRLGMAYEGRIRDHVFTNGQWRDSLLYSVLAHEFE